MKHVDALSMAGAKRIEPLFKDEEEYEAFKERHARAKIERRDIKDAEGPLFLGIDAGSTTTKAALIDRDKNFCTVFTEAMKETLWLPPSRC